MTDEEFVSDLSGCGPMIAEVVNNLRNGFRKIYKFRKCPKMLKAQLNAHFGVVIFKANRIKASRKTFKRKGVLKCHV